MLTQYIDELRKKIFSPEATVEDRERFSYAQSYKKGADALKAYRDRLIAREINAVHDKDAQFAILFNKDTEPEEYEAYQAFRIECKAKVDEHMAKLKAELEASIKLMNQPSSNYPDDEDDF